MPRLIRRTSLSYIKPVTGLPTFAMVSAVSIIDPLLSYPHRLVLSILALHADRTGKSEPSQELIASLAGWFTKDSQGNRVPNKSHVSSLINNENYAKKSDRCGPGLVQLGYVKPGHRQKGFNQTNTYYLTTPDFVEGSIRRPDGTETDARFTKNAKREVTSVYKARKRAEQRAHEVKHAGLNEPSGEANHLPQPTSDTYSYLGEKYSREDCEIDLLNWLNGFMRDVPDAVYHYFKIEMPAIV